jgi:hypothetical protein
VAKREKQISNEQPPILSVALNPVEWSDDLIEMVQAEEDGLGN